MQARQNELAQIAIEQNSAMAQTAHEARVHRDQTPAWMKRLYAGALMLFAAQPFHVARKQARDYVLGQSKHGRGRSNGSNRKRIEHTKKRRQMAKASRRRNRAYA